MESVNRELEQRGKPADFQQVLESADVHMPELWKPPGSDKTSLKDKMVELEAKLITTAAPDEVAEEDAGVDVPDGDPKEGERRRERGRRRYGGWTRR